MKKVVLLTVIFSIALTACGAANGLLPTSANSAAETAAAQPTATLLPTTPPLPTDTPTPAPTDTPEPTPTPAYPPEGLGPAGFPENVNPLTGLEVDDPGLLNRRPVAVKVANLPRDYRPQWGLSRADIVYEYYTEQGSTRFAAIYLGENAEQVGPVRSGRFFDANVVRMYSSLLAFGSADQRVLQRFLSSEYSAQLVSEYPAKCPSMCRYEPNGVNYLMANTAEISNYAKTNKMDSGRPNLDGMFFKLEAPEGGQPADSFIVRFSAAIQNKWDYDPAIGQYLRSSETADDLTNGLNESFAPLTDRLTGESIGAETVVVIMVPHEYYSREPEIVDMQFLGTGTAYAFRDGQGYAVKWSRPSNNSVLSLVTQDGQPFPFKPGNTWFEVMGLSTKVVQNTDNTWRFTFLMP